MRHRVLTLPIPINPQLRQILFVYFVEEHVTYSVPSINYTNLCIVIGHVYLGALFNRLTINPSTLRLIALFHDLLQVVHIYMLIARKESNTKPENNCPNYY